MKRIALVFIVLLSLFATSCSVNYHVRKAIKKGYRCDTILDTIEITSIDSIPVIVHDSIVWEKYLVTKDTVVKYNTSYVPKTRWQTKIEYKLKRDTIRQIQKVEVAKYKSQKKGNGNLWLFIIGFSLGFVARWLLKFSKLNL
jgi:sulfur carrier protein ThiS